jgi:hypothetical protein
MLTRRGICALLVVSMTVLPPAPADAAMISVETATTSAAQSARQALMALLNRPEAVRQLEAMGIEPKAAQARVAALSEDEALALAAQSQLLPAGGDYGGGGGGGAGLGVVLVIVLIVLLIIWLTKTQ